MTGREKILAALSPAGTPHAPIVLCYPEIFMRDQWEHITREPWWMMHTGDDVEVGIRVSRDLQAVTGEDRVRLWQSPPHRDRGKFRIEGLDATTARKIDLATGQVEILRRPPKGGFVSQKDAGLGVAPVITSREQIDELLPLPPEETAATLADGRDERPRRTVRELGEYMPWTQINTPFDPLPYIWGFDGLMMACCDSPELVEYGAQRSLAVNLRKVATWRLLGAELLWIQECMTDQISPAQYRRFNLPYLQQLTAAIRRAGMYGIYYYCGNPNDRLELLLESGAHALALEESKKGFDIDVAEIAAKVDGRMALLGNLDAMVLLERGPVSAIRTEVARQLSAGRRNSGRFIIGIGSPVTPDTPLAHLRAVADAVHELAP